MSTKNEVSSQSNIMLQVVEVPKKLDLSGRHKWRVIIDYRTLNECNVGDKYSLSIIRGGLKVGVTQG